jgi:uncharacterized protein (DUF362 family)/ferredoxin
MPTKYVSLVRCADYSRQSVLESVRRAIDLLGGIESFVLPGDKVLLKPNLLQPADPEKHITTHTEVIYAAAKVLIDHGCSVVIADSPGTPPYSVKALRNLYRASGLDRVAEELGVELSLDTGCADVPNPHGKLIKRFQIVNPALEADAVVVVSKAKTHVQTGMTGAAKNMFGLVPGLEKSALHARLQSIEDFSDMILDLNELIRPRLQIVDAVVGMEGNGPSAGSPRKIGALLASPDYSAADVVLSKIMSFHPLEVSTIRAAVSRGRLLEDLSDVCVLGEKLDDFVVKDFKKPLTGQGLTGGGLRALINMVIKPYSLRPRVISDRCTGCQRCRSVCPKGAISMRESKAKISYADCIRCYCCHEMCPDQAIDLERSLLGKTMAAILK